MILQKFENSRLSLVDCLCGLMDITTNLMLRLHPSPASSTSVLLSDRTQYSLRTLEYEKNISTISLYGKKIYQLHGAQQQLL